MKFINILVIGVTILALDGCRAFYENSGSRTEIGNVSAPIEVSDTSDSVTCKLLYTMKGATVWTAKDALVKISYRTASTNTYFGVASFFDTQDLTVEIEPLQVDPAPTESATSTCP